MSNVRKDAPDPTALAPGAEPVELDEGALRSLSEWRPDGGVLSVLADMDPAVADPRAAAGTAIRDGLRQAQETLRETGPRDRWAALERVLDANAEAIEALTRPEGPGRGRALLLPLDGGTPRVIAVHQPLASGVSLGQIARLIPFARLLDEGPTVAIAAAAHDRVDLDVVRLWTATRVSSWELPRESDPRERTGPAAANPAHGQQAVTHVEREQSHLDDRLRRFLDMVGGAMASGDGLPEVAGLVVTGPSGVAEHLAESVSEHGGPSPRVVHLDVAGTAANRNAERLADEIDDVAQARVSTFLDGVLEAVAEGRGASGVGALPDALREGRVARLAVSLEADTPGFVGEDGVLQTLPLGSAERVPSLLDEVLARALATGAQVTVVAGADAERLEPHEGVAAELRW